MSSAATRTRPELAEDSFLRPLDARTKLALALLASSALILPMPDLLVFAVIYTVFVRTAGIGEHAWAQVRRVRWLLAVLFVLDWVLIEPALAVTVTLRLALLVSAFEIVLATTRPDELRRGLERLGVPESAAFSLAVSLKSLGDLEHEWERIAEAQRARGLDIDSADLAAAQRLRHWWSHAPGLVVPAIVLATKRAWSTNEAAAVRGFGAPKPAPESRPLPTPDRWLLAAAVAGFLLLALWR